MQPDLFPSSFEHALTQYEIALGDKFGRAPNINMPLYEGDDLAKLRYRLIMEEADEVGEELCPVLDKTVQSKARLAKELADLLYVTFGTAVAYGIPIQAAFDAVHRDNMARLLKGKLNPETGKLEKPKNWPKLDLTALVG